MKYDVISIGSATIDAFAKAESELVKIMGSDKEVSLLAFPTGSKLLISHLNFNVGGGGTNAAVCLSRLGFKVSFLGKIGDDHNALKVISLLRKEHVDISLVRHGKGVTGFSIILDSAAHDRAILACKGINDDLSFREITKAKLNTRWFYFSSMMNESYKTLEKCSLYAEKHKIRILFNPSTYLVKKGVTYLREVLRRTEILIFNREEAVLLTEKKDMKEMFRVLLTLGPNIVVITDGAKGAYAADHRYVYHVKPRVVHVVDSTGAGDAFAATFLGGIIKKDDIEFSLKIASTNAEAELMQYGAKNGLLNWNSLLKHSKREVVKSNL